MRNIKRLFVTLLAIMIAVSAAFSQMDIISAKEFKALYKSNKDLIVIDGAKSKKYKKNHIKGAIRINHNKLYKKGDVKGILLDVPDLEKYFGDLGISNTSTIVITDGGSQKYNSRIYWILKYLGAENVQVLHKDMAKWGKNRIALTAAVPAPRDPVTFTATVNPKLNVSTAYVIENLENPNVVLVDNRAQVEYDGLFEKDLKDLKQGHIPGAIPMNYKELLTENGAYKSREELQAIADSYGLTPDKEIIFHCRTSVRGAVGYIAFKNILGYEKVRLYDGALAEFMVERDLCIEPCFEKIN